MDIKEFMEKVAEVLDDMDVNELTPETDFHELDDWSSISALGMIAMADEEFDVELKGDDIRNAKSIRELYDLIQSKA